MDNQFQELDAIFRDVEAGKPFPLLDGKQQAMFIRALLNGGINLDPTATSLLTETQLRDDLTKGRGPGMVSALKSEYAVRTFFEICRENSEGGKKIVSNTTGEPISGSEGRGMRQLGADFISLALAILLSYDEQIRAITDRINKRLWRSWEIVLDKVEKGEENADPDFDDYTEGGLKQILAGFEALELEKPTAKTASLYKPDDNVWTIWQFLKGMD